MPVCLLTLSLSLCLSLPLSSLGFQFGGPLCLSVCLSVTPYACCQSVLCVCVCVCVYVILLPHLLAPEAIPKMGTDGRLAGRFCCFLLSSLDGWADGWMDGVSVWFVLSLSLARDCVGGSGEGVRLSVRLSVCLCWFSCTIHRVKMIHAYPPIHAQHATHAGRRTHTHRHIPFQHMHRRILSRCLDNWSMCHVPPWVCVEESVCGVSEWTNEKAPC